MTIISEPMLIAKDHTKNEQAAIALLLAEHSRIAALYQLNSEMGDKLVAIYIAIISITQAVMVGIIEFQSSISTLIPVELILLVVIIVIGSITYARLLERRERSVEYLRAINRIHHYFIELDGRIQNYLYWRACDDCPSVQIQGTAIGGLRDLVAVVNSIVIGVGITLLAYAMNPNLIAGFLILIALTVMVISWLVHQKVQQERQKRFEIRLSKKIMYRTPPDLIT